MKRAPFMLAAATLTLWGCAAGRRFVAESASERHDTIHALLSEQLSLTLHGVEFNPELAGPVKRVERLEIQRGRQADMSARSDSAATARTQPAPAAAKSSGRWWKWLLAGFIAGVVLTVFAALRANRPR